MSPFSQALHSVYSVLGYILFAPCLLMGCQDNWSGGCVVGDCENGQGVYDYGNDNFYNGQWRNGERNGQGTIIREDGAVYVGQWLNDEPHGFGSSASMFRGWMYVGEFKYGKKNGFGKMFFPNGEVYIGHFLNSKIHGKGTIYYPDSTKYEGVFEYGKPVDTHGKVEMPSIY